MKYVTAAGHGDRRLCHTTPAAPNITASGPRTVLAMLMDAAGPMTRCSNSPIQAGSSKSQKSAAPPAKTTLLIFKTLANIDIASPSFAPACSSIPRTLGSPAFAMWRSAGPSAGSPSGPNIPLCLASLASAVPPCYDSHMLARHCPAEPAEPGEPGPIKSQSILNPRTLSLLSPPTRESPAQ